MGIHQKSATIDIAQVKELSKLEGEFLARKEARDKELANIIKGEDERLL
ncbi:3-deoxy-7-phosphoheptulonate synthase, partial [Streptococcus suis]